MELFVVRPALGALRSGGNFTFGLPSGGTCYDPRDGIPRSGLGLCGVNTIYPRSLAPSASRPLGSRLTGPVLNESPHPEKPCPNRVTPDPNSGSKCRSAGRAGIETPALPFDDSRALTRPNSPLPDPVPQANPNLGVTRTVNLVELPPLLGSVDSSQMRVLFHNCSTRMCLEVFWSFSGIINPALTGFSSATGPICWMPLHFLVSLDLLLGELILFWFAAQCSWAPFSFRKWRLAVVNKLGGSWPIKPVVAIHCRRREVVEGTVLFGTNRNFDVS
ncbi:hypothetical protein Nepgr_005252 [Nepenthes gracilis]|uniref:Uncharacterized protein n=1 Tax=Nepenthes gracilis TaxID=150966 RepID=A0AAD3S2Y0_NEPGR|nr:hypothetical protein Nepgr_005252 [Nepenthes gracilis]